MKFLLKMLYITFIILVSIILADENNIKSNSNKQNDTINSRETENYKKNSNYIIDSALVCKKWRLLNASLTQINKTVYWHDDYDDYNDGSSIYGGYGRFIIGFYYPGCKISESLLKEFHILKGDSSFCIAGFNPHGYPQYFAVWRTKKDSIIISKNFHTKLGGGTASGVVVRELYGECPRKNVDCPNNKSWKRYWIVNDTLRIVNSNKSKFIFVSENKQ